jgi:membrane protein YqaA with SNARE-associated domain
LPFSDFIFKLFYLRLPFWPCVAFMAVGKALRYAMLVWGWAWLVGLF